ncbi:MAG: hypothetical protein U9R05_06940 [Chloroflexota bacterium]|nr:hypothetical protein [Chloroflexota bacterium]
METKLDKETIDTMYKELTKEFDDADWKEFEKDMQKLKKATTDRKVIEIFVDMAWDLESFIFFLKDLEIDVDDFKALVGEAVYRKDEWST